MYTCKFGVIKFYILYNLCVKKTLSVCNVFVPVNRLEQIYKTAL